MKSKSELQLELDKLDEEIVLGEMFQLVGTNAVERYAGKCRRALKRAIYLEKDFGTIFGYINKYDSQMMKIIDDLRAENAKLRKECESKKSDLSGKRRTPTWPTWM